MTDIVPDLLEEIQNDFTKRLERDTILAELRELVTKGEATYKEASEYAARLGETLSSVLQDHISADMLPDGRMYYNIAERILGPLLTNNYELASNIAAQVQESLNQAAHIGLKAVRPLPDPDRLEGFISKISEADDFESVSWMLNEPVTSFTMSAVDDTLRENVEFHGRAGLSPKVTRISAGGCCEWCSQLAGKYDYPVDREVYRRHNYCRCVVLYDPGDGKVQNVHSKIIYASQAEAERDARIERAKKLERSSHEPDIIIPRSLSAKARDVLVSLPDGSKTRLTPGSRITDVEVIAGRGRQRKIDIIDILSERYPGTSQELWQKKKGVGFVDYEGESYKTNLHWYEEPTVGRVEFKIKPDAAGNWFYED